MISDDKIFFFLIRLVVDLTRVGWDQRKYSKTNEYKQDGQMFKNSKPYRNPNIRKQLVNQFILDFAAQSQKYTRVIYVDINYMEHFRNCNVYVSIWGQI